MPVYLKDIYDLAGLDGFRSVLIVPCRFCPAASMAVRKNSPYFEFLKMFLKTAAYEEYIYTIQASLEKMGKRADVFKSNLVHQFVVCMWTSRRRRKLMEQAHKYDAVLVLGCEAAVQTIHDAIDSTICTVFQGMKTEGIMSIKPRFDFPCNLSIELNRVTPLVQQSDTIDPWIRL
jgi:hypothetical protein